MGQRRESNIGQARRQSDNTLRERRTALFAPRSHIGLNALTQNKRPTRLAAEPRPLWQRVIAGERLPSRLFRQPKCEGTIEDHRAIAIDARELIRQRVFDKRVGSVFHLNLRFPWLRVMRLSSCALELFQRPNYL
jgi:hypothetical protein